MKRKAEHIWRYRDIDVIYEPAVASTGTVIALPLIDFIQQRFGTDRHFGTVFEWCAGPGFIGFALLAEGICDSLCLADLSPAAIECVNRTIRENQLQNRVRAYVSDNMTSVPQQERFDLVVGNPPSFCSINPTHPLSSDLSGNVIAHDSNWNIHAGFYSQIATFLNPNALMLILEVNLYDKEVFLGSSSAPLDIRPETPNLAFAKMIQRGGLTHMDNAAFEPDWHVAGLHFQIQVSANEHH